MKTGHPAIKPAHFRPIAVRMMTPPKHAACLLLCLALIPGLASAAAKVVDVPKQEQAPPKPQVPQTAPYDRDLMRLSEILGSIQYLRSLCNPAGEDTWRTQMQKLIELEAGKEPARKELFTASFNRGYRAFAALHATCTEAALEAERKYRAEGATLATEITARFGN